MLDVQLNYSKFIREFLVPVRFTADENEFLYYLKSDGGNYAGLAKIVEQNAVLTEELLGAINLASKGRFSEPISNVTTALSTLGFSPSRNLLASTLVTRQLKINFDSKVISENLRFSLLGESASSGKLFSGDRFQAGFIFDFLKGLAPPKLKLDPFVASVWSHGVLVSKVAQALSQALVPKMDLERQLCQDGLLHDVGRIVLAILTEGYYVKWMKENPKSKPGRESDQCWREEIKEFGWSHEWLGHMLLWSTRFLSESSSIALYHHRPFMLRTPQNSVYTRVTLVWLANQLIRHKQLHRGAFVKKRKLENWLNIVKKAIPELSREEFAVALKLPFD